MAFRPSDDDLAALGAGQISARELARQHGVATSTVTRYPSTKRGKAQVRALELRERERERGRRRRAAKRAAERGDDRAEDRRAPDASGSRTPKQGKIDVVALRRLNRLDNTPPLDWWDRTKLVPSRELHADLIAIRSPEGRTRRFVELHQLDGFVAQGWAVDPLPGRRLEDE